MLGYKDPNGQMSSINSYKTLKIPSLRSFILIY